MVMMMGDATGIGCSESTRWARACRGRGNSAAKAALQEGKYGRPLASALQISFAGYAKATSIGSGSAADHVEQATHDALAIGPQPVVYVLVGNPGPQPTNATGRLLGK